MSYSKILKQDLNNLFISDPYIHHLLEKEEKTKVISLIAIIKK